ncbi:MAG: hypothetical protein RL277_3002 [Planctomycetota bacterium]
MKHVAGLIALLAVCAALLRWLPSREARPAVAAQTLLAAKPAEQVAGFTISAGPDASWRYVRSKGQWRCLDAQGAFAEESAVQELLRAALETRGTPVPFPAAADPVWKLELQGSRLLEREDRHVLVSVELLRRFDGPPGGHALARVSGAPERVLDIDTDLAQLAKSAGPALPPLLDARLGAGCFDNSFRYFQRYFFDYTEGPSFEVRSSPRAEDPARLDWVLAEEGRAMPAIEWRAGGYGGIWIRAKALAFASRQRLAQLGLEPPFLTMVAQPDSGPALVIRAARPTLSRECWIYNETSGLLMQVDPALLEQILATPAMFTDASRPNPFERWLRK